MIFSKNLSNNSNTILLKAEFKRLKALYSKALELKNEETVKILRKEIKLLKTRWNILSNDNLV